MTKKLLLSLSTGVAVLISSAASAEMTWTDPAGDQSTGNPNLDVVKATMSNDATNLYIGIEVADLSADWGKHMFFFDTGHAGHTGTSNPWFREVDHFGNEVSHIVGSWLDGGAGGNVHQYDAGSDSWSAGSGIGVAVDWAAHRINYTIALSDLGVGIGDTVRWDHGTTGGSAGDPLTDMFSSGTHGSWGSGSNLGADLPEFTIVPAPATLALLGFTGLFARRRRA